MNIIVRDELLQGRSFKSPTERTGAWLAVVVLAARLGKMGQCGAWSSVFIVWVFIQS